MVFGFSDLRKNFFCSAISICENEDSNTYLWIFESIKAYLINNGLCFKPKNIIADNSVCISKTIQLFDPKLLRTNCWAHIYRLMRPVIDSLGEKLSNDIKKEIIFLQGLTNRKLYEQGIELFKLKYGQFSVTKTFLSKFFK